MDRKKETSHGYPVEKTPWLSVVVPIYNAQNYLDRCVRSVLSQTFRDFELLLMDDGSTDQTQRICEAYAAKDPRVKYCRKENTGSYHNRLCGFYQANGAYITAIDSDDYYLSDTVLQTLYDAIRETPCDFLQFGIKQVYRHLSRRGLVNQDDCFVTGEAFRKKEYIRLFGVFTPDQHLFACIGGKMYSRRLLKDLPAIDPPERLFFGDDVVLNLHVLRDCQSARFLPLQLYAYRETSGGTKRFSKAAMQDLNCVSCQKLRILSERSDLDVPAIEYRIFADIAGSLLDYTQSLVRNLSEEETTAKLEESLALPGFQLARDYFRQHPEHTWTGVALLRKGDPSAYIEEAKQRMRKNRLKRSVKSFLKTIYSKI